jgi:hypothetical protein
MSQNHDQFDFNLNWPVDELRDEAVSRARQGQGDQPSGEQVGAEPESRSDDPSELAVTAPGETPTPAEPPLVPVPGTPGSQAGPFESPKDGYAVDDRRVSEWLEVELASMRGELRSWLNEAFASLRADLDVKASELLERQIAVAGLVKVATELQERQFAVAELVEVARTGRRMAELVDRLPEQLSAFDAGVEAASRSSAEARAAVEEARSVLATIKAAAAATQAKADELASLPDELSEQTKTLAKRSSDLTDELTSRLNETLARQDELLSLPIEALPARVAEAVGASVRPEDTHTVIRNSVSELRTLLDDVQSSITEMRDRLEDRQDSEEAEVTRTLLEELVENGRVGQRLAAVVDALPGRIDEAVRASLRAANEASGAGAVPMVELGSVLSSVRSSISDLRSRLDEPAQAPNGAPVDLTESVSAGSPRVAEAQEPDASPEATLPSGDVGAPSGSPGETAARQTRRFLGRRSSRRPSGDPSPATAGRGGDE